MLTRKYFFLLNYVENGDLLELKYKKKIPRVVCRLRNFLKYLFYFNKHDELGKII